MKVNLRDILCKNSACIIVQCRVVNIHNVKKSEMLFLFCLFKVYHRITLAGLEFICSPRQPHSCGDPPASSS